MSEVWYFARDDEERGPFTESQMRTLVSAGRVRDHDLVWKEGSEDWVMAVDAVELQIPAPPEPPVAAARDSSVNGSRSNSAVMPLPDTTPAATPQSVSPVTHEASRTTRAIAYLLIAIGFLGVLAAKGFESLTSRNVQRLEAIVALQQSEFEANWDEQRSSLEAERAQLRDNVNLTAVSRRRMDEIDSQLGQLAINRANHRAELENGVWRERRQQARDAEQHEKIWAFWRQVGFLAATVVFCAGLLVMGLIGETAERSISLLIMGVIAYSLFVGGSAWQ